MTPGAGVRWPMVRWTRGLRARVAGDAEAGSGTVLVLSVACVVWCVGVAGACAGSAVVARHRAGAAADLAALAAADHAAWGAPAACAEAARVAGSMRATLVRCGVHAGVADVSVRVPFPWARLPTGDAHGGLPAQVTVRSRAGPASGGHGWGYTDGGSP